LKGKSNGGNAFRLHANRLRSQSQDDEHAQQKRKAFAHSAKGKTSFVPLQNQTHMNLSAPLQKHYDENRAFLECVLRFFSAFVLMGAALIVFMEQGGNFFFFLIKNSFLTFIYGAIVILCLLKPWIDRWLFVQKKSDAQRV
jgi:hypothetical protein